MTSSPSTVSKPFEEQAARSPDAVALCDEDGARLTYRQLDERVNRLAHVLGEQGAGPGTRVGICLERGIPQVVAIHATVRIGAAYVPLDAELPDSRLALLLDDAAPAMVLTDRGCRARLPLGPWQVLDVGADREPWDDRPATPPRVAARPDDLLHILYTSGTTGRPKGVAYPASGVVTHLAWMQSRYPFGPGDTALFKTSAGFDVSVWELFWPLWHGARLVVCRPGGHRDPRHLAEVVARYDVTTLFLPPTVMAPFLEEVPATGASALRWALCGGEPVAPRIRDTFYTALPSSTMVSCYGPTEAGSVTDHPLRPEPGAPVPLGHPSDNFRILLLDEHLREVPAGTPGEAYLRGQVGLAQGYWRAPGRTAERFVADPFGAPGSRLYRTGDLCRERADGLLEHLGRIDRQIKIRGLRVEPGEIESVLVAHPEVADCAVVPHGDPVRLLAFVVPADGPGAAMDIGALLDHAAAELPVHMRPDEIVPVPRILATVNGKIDEQALLSGRRERADRVVIALADPLEAVLIEIYGRVLGIAEVGVLDTFVRLGGSSLLATRLVEECAERLHAAPPVAQLLTGTVREVAATLRARAAVPGSEGPAPAVV